MAIISNTSGIASSNSNFTYSTITSSCTSNSGASSTVNNANINGSASYDYRMQESAIVAISCNMSSITKINTMALSWVVLHAVTVLLIVLKQVQQIMRTVAVVCHTSTECKEVRWWVTSSLTSNTASISTNNKSTNNITTRNRYSSDNFSR